MSDSKNDCSNCEAKSYAEGVLAYYLGLSGELDNNKTLMANFYHLFMRLVWYGTQQPKAVSEQERNFMHTLTEEGYSIGEIAWILDRSKSTVHENLEKAKVETVLASAIV